MHIMKQVTIGHPLHLHWGLHFLLCPCTAPLLRVPAPAAPLLLVLLALR